jgi:hypothetical protein
MSIMKGRDAPPVLMIRLTETRDHGLPLGAFNEER